MATLVHQVLAVLDLSPQVAQVLVLGPVLLLEVFELQDQQELLLVDDDQPLLLILACGGGRREEAGEVPATGREEWSGRGERFKAPEARCQDRSPGRGCSEQGHSAFPGPGGPVCHT